MAIRTTAIYFIIAGLLGAILPLLDSGLQLQGFIAVPFIYQLGSYTREVAISVAFLISGWGLLKYKLWARKLGLVTLALACFYGGHAMSWNWSGGKPSAAIVTFSYALCILWYGIWFVILYRPSTITELTERADDHSKSDTPP